MLDQDMQEARTGVIDIPDVNPDTLKQMLEYIYTGQVFILLFIEILKKQYIVSVTRRSRSDVVHLLTS